MNPVHRNPAPQIEQPAHALLPDTEPSGKGGMSDAAVPHGEGKCRLGRGFGGHGDEMLTRTARAGIGNRFPVVDAPRDSLLQRVGGFAKGFRFVGAGGKAFR